MTNYLITMSSKQTKKQRAKGYQLIRETNVLIDVVLADRFSTIWKVSFFNNPPEKLFEAENRELLNDWLSVLLICSSVNQTTEY